MYLQSIKFNNFRGIKNLFIKLNRKLNVIVGINGSGKTTVLDGCSIVLSDIKSKTLGKKNIRKLEESDINIGENLGGIEAEFFYSEDLKGEVKFYKSRGISLKKDDVDMFEILSNELKKELERESNIPVFIYYKTHRAVLDVPLKIKKKHQFTILEAYDGSLDGDANFRLFFEWFRNEEDLENENKVSVNDIYDGSFREKIQKTEQKLAMLEDILKSMDRFNLGMGKLILSDEEVEKNHKELNELKEQVSEIKGEVDKSKSYIGSLEYKKLFFVRQALKAFLPNIGELYIQRNPLAMIAKKNNTKLRLEQFSQGEKIYIAMIGDLARRLTIANPLLDNPLEGKGIILIDEVELHLHPKWQSEVVSKLTDIFPNCQFIITTHSPQVIREVEKDSIFLLSANDVGDVSISNPIRTVGLDSSEILMEIMDSPVRNKVFNDLLDEVYKYIECEKYKEARNKLDEMEKKFSDIPEIIKARSFLEFMEDE